jgi:hypothetical protein
MLVEEIDRQLQGTISLWLAVGPATESRKGVVGAGIFVDRHQRIRR